MLQRIKETAKKVWIWTKWTMLVIAVISFFGFVFWLDKLRFCI